jgi:hypothetical protein
MPSQTREDQSVVSEGYEADVMRTHLQKLSDDFSKGITKIIENLPTELKESIMSISQPAHEHMEMLIKSFSSKWPGL